MQKNAIDKSPKWLLGFYIFLQIYICGRIGLIIHEVVGHGLPAIIFGEKVHEIELTYFAGGWITFDLPDQAWMVFVVTMGGIFIELLIGGTILLLHNKKNRHPLLILCAMVLIIHALFYLTDGTQYGYGDGRILYRQFKEQLFFLSFFNLGLLSATTFILFKSYSNYIIPWMSAQHYNKCCSGLFVAVIFSVVIHGALTYTETNLKLDPVAEDIYTHEPVKVFEEYRDQHQELSFEEILETEEGSEIYEEMKESKEVPFREILFSLLTVSALSGLYFSKKIDQPYQIEAELKKLTLISIGLGVLISILDYIV